MIFVFFLFSETTRWCWKINVLLRWVRLGYLQGTGLVDKSVWNQVNNAQVKDLSDCKPGSRVGNRPFALFLERRESGLILWQPRRRTRRRSKWVRRQTDRETGVIGQWASFCASLFESFDSDKRKTVMLTDQADDFNRSRLIRRCRIKRPTESARADDRDNQLAKHFGPLLFIQIVEMLRDQAT